MAEGLCRDTHYCIVTEESWPAGGVSRYSMQQRCDTAQRRATQGLRHGLGMLTTRPPHSRPERTGRTMGAPWAHHAVSQGQLCVHLVHPTSF